jgi:hypothetical protein
MKECPVCHHVSLEKVSLMGADDRQWSCTNPDCKDFEVVKNFDIDDD